MKTLLGLAVNDGTFAEVKRLMGIPEWETLRSLLNDRRTGLRTRLEGNVGWDETNFLRGQCSELRELLQNIPAEIKRQGESAARD